MSCQALELSDGRAVLHCTTSGVVFGKVFPSPDAVDEFAFYAARVAGYRDPRVIPDDKIEDVIEAWRAWSPTDDLRAILGKVDDYIAEHDECRWGGTMSPAINEKLEILKSKGLVEIDGYLVTLTDLGSQFVRTFC